PPLSDEQMAALETRALTRHRFHGEWNYTLLPAWRAAPPPPPDPAPRPAAALAPVVSALASPELTGLPRPALAALAASLELRWAAAREQRLHLDRGHPRQAATGPAAPFRYTLETLLLPGSPSQTPHRAAASANSTISTNDSPQTQLILECLPSCPDRPRKPNLPRKCDGRDACDRRCWPGAGTAGLGPGGREARVARGARVARRPGG